MSARPHGEDGFLPFFQRTYTTTTTDKITAVYLQNHDNSSSDDRRAGGGKGDIKRGHIMIHGQRIRRKE